MNDDDRARGVLHDLTDYIDASDADEQDVAVLVAEFAAVRAEERARIVAYLRRRVQEAIAAPLVPLSANTTAVYVASVTGEADRIERGESSS